MNGFNLVVSKIDLADVFESREGKLSQLGQRIVLKQKQNLIKES